MRLLHEGLQPTLKLAGFLLRQVSFVSPASGLVYVSTGFADPTDNDRLLLMVMLGWTRVASRCRGDVGHLL